MAVGQLQEVDATLRLLDPEADPTKWPGKRPYKRVNLFGAGSLNRLILGALRRGETPMTTAEVVASIVEELGSAGVRAATYLAP